MTPDLSLIHIFAQSPAFIAIMLHNIRDLDLQRSHLHGSDHRIPVSRDTGMDRSAQLAQDNDIALCCDTGAMAHIPDDHNAGPVSYTHLLIWLLTRIICSHTLKSLFLILSA